MHLWDSGLLVQNSVIRWSTHWQCSDLAQCTSSYPGGQLWHFAITGYFDIYTASSAFRTSLTKYLEQIRYQAVYSTCSNGDSSNATKKLIAPWWKNVIVRKSLLEECVGTCQTHATFIWITYRRFKLLILSLSTHVLMKALGPIHFETMSLCRFATFLLCGQLHHLFFIPDSIVLTAPLILCCYSTLQLHSTCVD